MLVAINNLNLFPVLISHEGRTVSLSASAVPAGFPSPAGDDLEDQIDPISWIVRHPSATFWWRVSGDSLLDEGIHYGKLIAVDYAGKKKVGVIVFAVVDAQLPSKRWKSVTGYMGRAHERPSTICLSSEKTAARSIIIQRYCYQRL